MARVMNIFYVVAILVSANSITAEEGSGHLDSGPFSGGSDNGKENPFGNMMNAFSSNFGGSSGSPFGGLGGSGNPFGSLGGSGNPFASLGGSGNPFGGLGGSGNPFGSLGGSGNPFGGVGGSGSPFGSLGSSGNPFGGLVGSGNPFGGVSGSGTGGSGNPFSGFSSAFGSRQGNILGPEFNKESNSDDQSREVNENSKGERDSDSQSEEQPESRLFFSSLFNTRLTTCNYTIQAGATCSSCREVMRCRPNNVATVKRCGLFFPYCNNGRCSLFPGAACNPTTTVAAATTTNAATTIAATTNAPTTI